MADKITLITQEEFERYINHIRARTILHRALNDAFYDYNQAQEYCASIDLPTLEPDLVELLEKVTHDEDEWIRYWIYEIDFGRKYHRWGVTIDDKPVWLLTTENLWDLLNGNPLYDDG